MTTSSDAVAGHARLAPSSASRWVACPASVQHLERLAEEGIVEPDRSGREAAVGSTFHHFIALCLETGADPVEFIGDTYKASYWKDGKQHEEEIPFDEEMVAHAEKCLEWFERRTASRKWDFFIERRLDLSEVLVPGQFGTLDVGAIGEKDPILMVVDWKYGAGVPVSPKENTQAMIYAAGLWNAYAPDWLKETDPERVTIDLEIVQPRCHNGGGGWMLSKADLDARIEKISEAARLAIGENPPFNPGETQCKFCPAARAARCSAYDKWAFDTLSAEFDDDGFMSLPDVAGMSDEKVVDVLRNAPMIRQWLDALHARLYETLMHGKDIPGARLVVGRRPPRRFDSSRIGEAVVMAEMLLGPDAVVLKPDTISALERKFGKEAVSAALGDYIVQGQPKPVISFDEDDNRQPYDIPVDEFTDDDV